MLSRALVALFVVGLLALGLPALGLWAQQSSYLVQGSVVDSTGLAATAALVQVSGWNGGVIATGLTDSNGSFEFEVNSAGPYQIEVITPNATQTAEYEAGMSQGLVIHMPGPLQPASHVDAAHSTVSLNDLQASHRAQTKLAGAQKAIKKSEWSRAWKLVNEAIAAAPNWGRAYLMRGALNLNQRNFASAKADFAVALERDPRNSMTLTELGKLYSTTGDLQRSEDYLRRALATPPVTWPTYYEMANLDLKQHKFSEAATMAARALQCQPGPPPTIYFLAGEAAYHLGQWQFSKDAFEQFVAKNKPTPELEKALAQAHLRLEQLAQMSAHQ